MRTKDASTQKHDGAAPDGAPPDSLPPAGAAPATLPPDSAPLAHATRHRKPVQLVPGAVLALTVAWALFFSAWPLILMVAKSLDGGFAEAVTRYAQVLADAAPLVGNSAFSGALAAILSTALALAVALCTVFGAPKLRGILRTATLLSMVTPPFVASLAYIQLFGKRGLITHGLLGLSVSPYGWLGVVIMQALFFCAVNVMLLTAVLSRIDPRLMQAARGLGARPARVFGSVVMPLVWPTLLACLLLTFVRSISDYGTPVVIGGPFNTVATQIYVELVGYSDLSAVAVLNMVLLVVSGGVFFAQRALDRRTARLVEGTMGAGASEATGSAATDGASWRITGPVSVAAHAVALGFAAFIAVLYATVIRSAFTKGVGADAPFTWDNFAHLAEFDLPSLGRSLAFGAAAAVLGTCIGAAVAYFSERRRIRGGRALSFAVAMPYMLPGTCLGLGYILAFNGQMGIKLTGGAFIVIAVLVTKQLTIAVNAFSTSMAQVSRDLDLAARGLGAPEARMFLDVIWPNVREAALLSLINGFSAAMMSYGALLFLVSPSTKTAVVQLFDALASGKYGQAAAVAVVLVAVTLACNAAAAFVSGRRGR